MKSKDNYDIDTVTRMNHALSHPPERSYPPFQDKPLLLDRDIIFPFHVDSAWVIREVYDSRRELFLSWGSLDTEKWILCSASHCPPTDVSCSLCLFSPLSRPVYRYQLVTSHGTVLSTFLLWGDCYQARERFAEKPGCRVILAAWDCWESFALYR